VPPTRSPIDFKLGSKAIDIPAGHSGYVIEDRYTAPVDVDVMSIYPHAHYLAREMKVWATLPDGAEQGLLWIKDWDFRWQDQYRYETPVSLPRGTVISMRYTYDNSEANKRNPARVPNRVRYGPGSSDEMGDLWLRLLPHSRADAVVLARSYREHQLAKDIARGEQMIAAAPAEARWRILLGTAYIESGRVSEGAVQLEEALRLAPDHAEAHNNLARARQLQGETVAAIAGFREAARLAPRNDDILVNLADALQDNDEMAASIGPLERAIALNPSRAEAHNNLGVALASAGRIEEAIGHFEAALAIRPDDPDATGNLAQARQLRRPPGR
jgi:tetratricopeptide (TPR) repeat protein